MDGPAKEVSIKDETKWKERLGVKDKSELIQISSPRNLKQFFLESFKFALIFQDKHILDRFGSLKIAKNYVNKLISDLLKLLSSDNLILMNV